jgi:hypothetical protein
MSGYIDPEHNLAGGGLVYSDDRDGAHKMFSGDFAGGAFETTDVNGRYTDTRFGVRADVNSFYWRLGPEYGSNVAIYGPRASADVSVGKDGISVGAGLSAIGVDVTLGSLDPKETDIRVHGGLSLGGSLAGRIHYEDKDHNGLREYGVGADVIFFSFDVQIEDPVGQGASAVTTLWECIGWTGLA